jgi:hypothetical protein
VVKIVLEVLMAGGKNEGSPLKLPEKNERLASDDFPRKTLDLGGEGGEIIGGSQMFTIEMRNENLSSNWRS